MTRPRRRGQRRRGTPQRARAAEQGAALAAERLRHLALPELTALARANWGAAPGVMHGEALGLPAAAPLQALAQALCALLGLAHAEVQGDFVHLLKAQLAAAPGALLLGAAALDAAALAPQAAAAAQAALAAPAFSVPALLQFHPAAGALAGWAVAITRLHGAAAAAAAAGAEGGAEGGKEAARLRRASQAAALAGAQAFLAACEARAAALTRKIRDGDARALECAPRPELVAAVHAGVPDHAALLELASYLHVQEDTACLGKALCLLLGLKARVAGDGSGHAVEECVGKPRARPWDPLTFLTPPTSLLPPCPAPSSWWTPLKPHFQDARAIARHLQGFAAPHPAKEAGGAAALQRLADLTPASAAMLRVLIEGPRFTPQCFQAPALKGHAPPPLPPAAQLREWVLCAYAALPRSVLWAADRPALAAELDLCVPACALARARCQELSAAEAALELSG